MTPSPTPGEPEIPSGHSAQAPSYADALGSSDLVALARACGAKIENWLTMPPKTGLLYFTPEQLAEFARRASPSPPVPQPVQGEPIRDALRQAFQLGQTYWQQADSDSTSQWRKADVTRAKFDALVEETAALAAPTLLGDQPVQQQPDSFHVGSSEGRTYDRYNKAWEHVGTGQYAMWACHCEACDPIRYETDPTTGHLHSPNMRMIVCDICGNKRCPHATNHRNACGNSNEPGQKGSSWEHYRPPGEPSALSGKTSPNGPKDVPAVLQGDQQKLHDERAEFMAWVRDCGCDTDGAWSAWQARAKLKDAHGVNPSAAWCDREGGCFCKFNNVACSNHVGVPDTSGGSTNG